VGRWSRLVAREFLDWLVVRAHRRWLDVGCGTSALAETILTIALPKAVVGIDPSEPYIAFARTHVGDSRAAFAVGTAMALPFQAAAYDAVAAGLALNFVPQVEIAIAEMARVTRPGGVAAAYVWDYCEGMGIMRHFWDAAVALDPSTSDLDEGLPPMSSRAAQAVQPRWPSRRAGSRD
jgi:ubiquinone/menaquinone biosynthesis C-methylase UbiE